MVTITSTHFQRVSGCCGNPVIVQTLPTREISPRGYRPLAATELRRSSFRAGLSILSLLCVRHHRSMWRFREAAPGIAFRPDLVSGIPPCRNSSAPGSVRINPAAFLVGVTQTLGEASKKTAE